MLATNRSHTVCRCDHLTNFAVLMDLHAQGDAYGLGAGRGPAGALGLVAVVGAAVAIVCLLLAFILLTFFRTVKVCLSLGHLPSWTSSIVDIEMIALQSDRTTIHKNMLFCLLLAEVVLVCGVDRTLDRVGCGVVAGLLHYLLLCALTWTLLEGLQLYVMLVQVRRRASLLFPTHVLSARARVCLQPTRVRKTRSFGFNPDVCAKRGLHTPLGSIDSTSGR